MNPDLENLDELDLTDDLRSVTRHRLGHLLLIGLNRVPKRNAFNLDMREQLALAFGELERDPQIRVGVVFAHGDHFTGGLDLAEVGDALRTGKGGIPEGGVDWRGLHGSHRTKPVVCAIQGWCMTLGIEAALAADVRVATEDSRFSQMEVSRGIYPFGGATFRFPREVGWGNAMRHILTGDVFDAAEALRIGLVQEVVPTGEHLVRAVELAQQIAAQAPLGVQTSLRSAWRAQREGDLAAAAALIPELLALLDSQDAQEGRQSFLERRPAVFTGE
ncbi:crotonase/enoyl-CoA hydratase family protein [Amycolatopsis rhabdoformis]|uniref:Crotonase/enoyl-CoA hydratase family protein n=1 Tax=Amycolatopsis rhabdoformis TaxID=1448059 RepID=A0ABZ1IG28_9PSEU|nr:crotonase/enoyl-CoA hydratase family protein [Amycolatopsis rhabdoformis]WSE32509.1 crotonase/enoyl-CoA hydratase family protein [Amycolatopsis rhabdoformis]